MQNVYVCGAQSRETVFVLFGEQKMAGEIIRFLMYTVALLCVSGRCKKKFGPAGFFVKERYVRNIRAC